MKVSNGFALFGQQFPQTAAAHMAFLRAKAEESALDPKTDHLAYLAVLSAAGMTGGLGFHVGLAQRAGATDEEIKSAALVGMPAVGLKVLDGFAAVCAALESPGDQ
ncbi:MAG: carboxymuconolactone decarboxylase family protein [Propionibacteriaceae bacterium]|jgi:alkylhydroperoxidase/carboxymuconolactone decarboxylase family protein YurZ|nr:carboxymuconolactone decarboxylase family protein [Propionibacteriaceae bacterium]